MKPGDHSFVEQAKNIWAHMRSRRTALTRTTDEPPLRAELFSADQMEQHGKALAESHRLHTGRAPNQLLARLAENETSLLKACSLLTAAVKRKRRITPAGEWLLDNYYLIDDQIRTARKHLPKNYSRQLPRLSDGPAAGLPRVYDIALEAVAHGDGRLDAESLSRFVAAYQTVSTLKLGELWAIPIMLRLALIENLRRVAVRIAANRLDRNQADFWAERMMDVAENDPKSLILVIADMARSNQPLVSAFVAELARQLQGQSAALALPLTWVAQRLSESGSTIEQLVHTETQIQASAQVSISNCIGSLRFLASMDWREFVESMSVVEQKLREDPDGTYGKMDFATRDRYRHAVEQIANRGSMSEGEVARKAIQLANESAVAFDQPASVENGDRRQAHVGYYLIDKGLPKLRSAARVKLTAAEALRRIGRRFPLFLYLGSILLLTVLFSGGLLLAAGARTWPYWETAVAGVLTLLCVSQLSLSIVNWLASLTVPPDMIPRMDFEEGIPEAYCTLAVVPCMLGSLQDIDELVEGLEIRFLANRHTHLHFGLLTDFQDAPAATQPGDEALVQRVCDGITGLNEKYRNEGTGNFFLFHRPRSWNPSEQVWMGYERKRGKLGELNSLLRGGSEHQFSCVIGDAGALPRVKFVITLDTDTQLPRDAAHQLVGAMMHPLNRPHYDEKKKRVTAGYGILQPRVATSLPGTNRSLYARLCSSESGIDPYTRAVSDVYQDCFGEGAFIGKGIYDVDAFEKALDSRFPENRILSHDLLEGCYARSGLVSEVQFYEEYPPHYLADASRRHRWIRGDWQIAPWAFTRFPGQSVDRSTETRPQPNTLSALSRWKIFDNLRRSLVPVALTLFLLAGWILLAPAGAWTLSAFALVLLPTFLALLVEIFWRARDIRLSHHLFDVLRTARQRCLQAVFNLACLPHEAWYSLDAIIRTLARTMITHKHLLQWVPSSQVDRKPQSSSAIEFLRTFREMAAAPVLACATAAYLSISRPEALLLAAPVLLLWFAAPALAWWLSLPLKRRAVRLTGTQIGFLQTIARKTWAFFEILVGPEDNWLPPDNFQEHPVAVVAHRTSPTNIGLALLSSLSAYDFGYQPAGQLIERIANLFHTLEKLERYQGHFYNWYDTQTLRPLNPPYVSSVDSGNLAGHLLTLREGLLALPDDRAVSGRLFDGLGDTLHVLMEVAAAESPALLRKLVQFQKELESAYDSRPATFSATRQWLDRLTANAAEIESHFSTGHNTGAEITGEAAAKLETTSGTIWWAQALTRMCKDAQDELLFLAPWCALPPPIGGGEVPLNDRIPTLRELADSESAWLAGIEQKSAQATPAQRDWLAAARQHARDAAQRAKDRIAELERLAAQADEFAKMDYDFLYDKSRRLLAIGYNVGERRRDSSVYDLLASEARLASFVAIAQGQIPQESWFAMGRQLTASAGAPALMSWSGSMFEYLMPLLVMPDFENSLLDQTCRGAVERQIVYGFQRGVPWGMSESGYNAVDASLNYQYHAFGVPGLGLQRGLAEDLVVAPYASALALMVAPEQACLNLQSLADNGLDGQFGLFEAIDYTASRLPRGQSSVVVRSFMSHHQGMVLLAIAYLNLDRPMQKRFEKNPQFQATALLLHERIPKASASSVQIMDAPDVRASSGATEMPAHLVVSADTPMPEVQLLSNGRYHVMVTNSGGGYSRWKGLAVSRWGEDTTCDNWGSFCYIRDLASGEFWSNTHQPTLVRADTYEAVFSESRAEFRRRDFDYETHTEIVVSSEDDIELRRMRITNRSRVRRTIDVTSYAEVVLAPAVADALHPAFSNLFLQTEIIRDERAIICTRRPRSQGEPSAWMFHLMAVHGGEVGEVSYETDRSRFIGRGNSVASPQALHEDGSLSGSQGSVLDPVVAIRYRVTLDPEQSATVDMVTGVGDTREHCMNLVGKYQDRNLADRVFDLAWTHSLVSLGQINATEADAQLYSRLASCVIYAHASLRAEASVLARNRRGQSGLWGYGISGDLPIVLLQIGDLANIDLVRQMVQAHAYWRLKGLAVDLVIWNEDHAGYRQALQDQIIGLIAAGVEAQFMDRPGGIFVRRAEQISDEDRVLMHSVARVIITDRRGTLAEQVKRRGYTETRATYLNLPRLRPVRMQSPELVSFAPKAIPAAQRDLQFFNGFGGFSADGREYVITTTDESATPAPWVNVLANAEFGSVIAENGAAYTWSENAHEFRLTPWTNDAVCDTGGEAFYVRDEESGEFWSPTPQPCCGATPYVSRHGFGYSVFEHSEDGLRSELWIYVALDSPIRFSVLKLRNDSGRPRRVSATGYVEWVLGDLREKSAMHVITELDPTTGALCARNAYNMEFPDRVAFFDVDGEARTVSGDRTEFIGRNGTLENPAAMRRTRLSNKVGAALDPCGAIQVAFDLAPGQERELVFTLGSTRKQRADDTGKLIENLRGPGAARAALDAVRRYWTRTLGALQVETPDATVNFLANGWLLYQTLACRLWGRSGFYQSGGAFGFRDQLQDSMALVYAEPSLVREHLLRSAAHQFKEGDVLHWWHPPSDRGVRSHVSDDFLWLPLATCRYVAATGDTGVLEENVHFLEGRPVGPEEDSYYDLPGHSEEYATLYQHCVRAVVHGLRFGAHGLPLMGTGDWNDGMNLVGAKGKGESIWLGFFLYAVLTRFGGLAHRHNDPEFATRCEHEAEQLRRNLEDHGWDGAWYLRAYFDDGSPLGSAKNDECRIDSIAQSWSVLSGAGEEKHTHMALDALDKHLVRRTQKLVQLLEPPFDKTAMDPGYIKGYVPGVRENGGQYTHAAVWAAMAFAATGDTRRAWELFAIINPLNHSDSEEKIATYKVEPYVIAADVYALPPHTGRGGWTWYTGSAGWFYRLIVESLLGMQLDGETLHMAPCLPENWPSFTLHYRYRNTMYHITVARAAAGGTRAAAIQVTVDGVLQRDAAIHLVDDSHEHKIEVSIPSAVPVHAEPQTLMETL